MSDKHESRIRHHDPSEGFDYSEPHARQVIAFAAGSVVILVVMILALSAYFDKIYNEAVYEKVLSVPGGEVADLRQLEQWRLTHYEYVDNQKKTVRIPLDLAQELFLKEIGQGKYFYNTKPYPPKKEEPETPAAAAKEAEAKEAK